MVWFQVLDKISGKYKLIIEMVPLPEKQNLVCVIKMNVDAAGFAPSTGYERGHMDMCKLH